MQTFNYHTHTLRCNHADMVSDAAYVESHIKAGFDSMAFTEHCPWSWFDAMTGIPQKHRLRMRYDQKAEYLSSINGLKERYRDSIGIYSGYEVEFLPDRIDEIRQMHSESDILILGQHLIVRNGTPDDIHVPVERRPFEDFLCYADFVEKGLSTGLFRILAHPDLFMVMSKAFGKTEEMISDMVLKSAEKHDIPIEINLRQISKPAGGEGNDGDMAYPCPEFWKMATAYNVKVVYGLDVHRIYQLELHEKILDAANRRIGPGTLSKLHFLENFPL